MIIGYLFFKVGFKIFFKLNFNMDLLIVIGIFVVYLYGIYVFIMIINGSYYFVYDLYFELVVVILIFIILGKYLEFILIGKILVVIKKLIGLVLKEVIILRNGIEVRVVIEDVVVGDIIFVKLGDKLLVDGVVIFGYILIDELMLIGEFILVEK